jgi:hypothetical protein
MTGVRFADCRSSRLRLVNKLGLFASDEGGESGGARQSAFNTATFARRHLGALLAKLSDGTSLATPLSLPRPPP